MKKFFLAAAFTGLACTMSHAQGPSIPSTAPVAAVAANTTADLTPAEVAKLGWDALPQILAHIKAPTFPAKNFPITDFGGKADGVTDNTDAIRQAIEACNKAGGGHVVIPDGVTLTGRVLLLSNVDLHLSDNATLHFIVDPEKYPKVLLRYEGVEHTNYSPPIYAFEQENIGVTGKGIIDGGGEANWVRAVGMTSRPNFVVPLRCKNVIIEGLTIHNSPMWEINPVYCTNVIVRNLNIDSHQANNDGCDPDSCRYVLIEGCTFNTGDDCIAIKCGKDDDGRRVNLPSEFLIVRNCIMKDGHGGVTLGSECTPAIRNIFVENCQMDSPQLNAILRFKNGTQRGGIIENVYARNIDVGKVARGTSAAGFLIQYTYGGGGDGPYVPVLRNVYMANVKGRDVPGLVGLTPSPNSIIENINISDCVFAGSDPATLERYASQIKFTNVKILPAGADVGPPVSTLATPAAPAAPATPAAPTP